MLSMDHYTYWKEGVAEGMQQGLEQGLKQGLSEGTMKTKTEVALQMLRKRLSLEVIAEVTGLTVEQITTIGQEHKLL